MDTQPDIIYHIVTVADYRENVIGSMYAAMSLLTEGFIHCTSGRDTTLLVIEDYFSNISEPIYLLKIAANGILKI